MSIFSVQGNVKTFGRYFMFCAMYLLGESQVPGSQEESGPSSSQISTSPTPTTAPSTSAPSPTELSTTAPTTHLKDGAVPPAGGSSQTPSTRRDAVTA